MYRRNLVAYWTAQPGELRADECIEDIFAGGDGWGPVDSERERTPTGRAAVDDGNRLRTSHKHNRSHDSSRHPSTTSLTGAAKASQGVAGRTSLQHQANELMAGKETKRTGVHHEKDEIELRDDLRSWTLPSVTA